MFMRSPRNRVFDYPPRFYKPEEDPEERKKRKLNFRQGRKHSRKRKSTVYWVVLFFLILYLYFRFTGSIS